MDTRNYEKLKRILLAILLVFCFVVCAILFKAYCDGKFSSVETMQAYISSFGAWAKLVLIIIQAVQVLFPILPGFLGCAAGTVLFGVSGGFWCNYIGMSIGSLLAFLLARMYGQELVNKIFKGEKYHKWAERLSESKSYAWFLFIGILLPFFPDDFFCFFTGLTKMRFSKFATIIILGKPWYLLALSIILSKTIT